MDISSVFLHIHLKDALITSRAANFNSYRASGKKSKHFLIWGSLTIRFKVPLNYI